MFDKKLYADFGRGDWASYGLILENIRSRKFNLTAASEERLRSFCLPFSKYYSHMFIYYESASLPLKILELEKTAPIMVMRLSIHQSARKNFGYAKRGHPRTTIFVQAIISELSNYFSQAQLGGSRKAYLGFRKDIEKRFKALSMLHRLDLSIPESGIPQYRAVIRKIRRLRVREVIADGRAAGIFILNVKRVCGWQSLKADAIRLSQLRRLLTRAQNMHDFLSGFYAGPPRL